MSSIQEELNRLTAARDNIKGVLDRLNVSYEGDKLDSLATAVNTIQKVEATQENGIVTVPAGYIAEEQTFVVSSEMSAGYLINNDDGSVYFQKVKNEDGVAVADGEPVQITGVSIPETGVAEPDYAQGGGGADVILGQIDADGNFQPLTFNGTEASNSGSPETVENYYGWNGTLPSPSGGIKVVQGGSAVYYKCASVDTANKTWTGYLAVLTDGVYTFEETVTEGLTYGLIAPVVGNIYTDGALVNIKSLFMRIPTDYVFFDPLSDATGWELSETGAEVVADDTRNVFRTSGGSSYFVLTTDPGVPLGSSPRTVSHWFRNINSVSSWCGIGYGASGSNNRFTWGLRSGYSVFTLWADDNFQTSAGQISDNDWHHIVTTYDGSDKVIQYLDGVKIWEWSTGTTHTTWQYIHVGDPWESYACDGKFADMYIFDRVIEDYEIQSLYAARTV